MLNRICLFGICAVVLSLMASISQAQSVDIMEYLRYDTPPEYYEFVKVSEPGAEVRINRIVYTENFSYHEQSVLKIDRYENEENQEVVSNTLYVTNDLENFYFAGFAYNDSTFGNIDLYFNPRIPFPISVEIGQSISRSTQSQVSLGFLQATLDINATVTPIQFENVETPLGLFENALQVELELEAIWNGAVLSSTLRSEWYHPLAGLVKTMNRETGSTYLLTRVEPPLDNTAVQHWAIHDSDRSELN
jgi:hypothetical protein